MPDDNTTDAAERVADDITSTDQQTGKPDVPPEVKRALNKANKEAESLRLQLKQYEDRDKTELQKLSESATAAERRAADAELGLARYRVAVAKKLPAELVDRLRGTTEEELAADADSLLQLVGTTATRTDFDGGARTPAGKPADMNSLIRHAAGMG
jgi:hypothetical protein